MREQPASPGHHLVFIVLDLSNAVKERFERNNRAEVTIAIAMPIYETRVPLGFVAATAGIDEARVPYLFDEVRYALRCPSSTAVIQIASSNDPNLTTPAWLTCREETLTGPFPTQRLGRASDLLVAWSAAGAGEVHFRLTGVPT